MKINALLGYDTGFDADINGISYDSRYTKRGDVFFCIAGSSADGHSHAAEAYNAGARVFVAEKALSLPSDAVVIHSECCRRSMALAASRFFGNPASSLLTIGITGTKGKTGTAYMLKNIFEASGRKTGVIGTLGTVYGNTIRQSDNTTPESVVIHESLKSMLDDGCDTVVIETSSQGFKQHRTDGITFDVGIFTNISPDHISQFEHHDFAEYLSCKRTLLAQSRKAVVNADINCFDSIVSGIRIPITTFGTKAKSDYVIAEPCFKGCGDRLMTSFVCEAEGGSVRLELGSPGSFSIFNAQAAVAAARICDISWESIKKGLAAASVEGRMEIVPTGRGFTVIIDFAHNAISCMSLFETLREYKPKRIISVFGCGGGRDRSRRYDMGRIIGDNSDICVVTSDNPRFEDPDAILHDINLGLLNTSCEKHYIQDRAEAIKRALSLASAGDFVLLLGKGHEHYEEINGIRYPFCERDIVKDYLSSSTASR